MNSQMEKHLGQGSKRVPEAGASVSMELGGTTLLHGDLCFMWYIFLGERISVGRCLLN